MQTNFIFLPFISEIQNPSYFDLHLKFEFVSIYLRPQLQIFKLFHSIISISLHPSYIIFLFIARLIRLIKYLNSSLFQFIFLFYHFLSFCYFYSKIVSSYSYSHSLNIKWVSASQLALFGPLSFIIQITFSISKTILRNFDFLLNICTSFLLNSMILSTSFSHFSNPLYVFIFQQFFPPLLPNFALTSPHIYLSNSSTSDRCSAFLLNNFIEMDMNKDYYYLKICGWLLSNTCSHPWGSFYLFEIFYYFDSLFELYPSLI